MNEIGFLSAFFSKDTLSFAIKMKDFLIAKSLDHFTIWQVGYNTVCTPLANKNGVSDGVFDLVDLGYAGRESSSSVQSLYTPAGDIPLSVSVFCAGSSNVTVALTFHKELAEEDFFWLLDMAPFIGQRVAELNTNEHRLDMFVDYQKKINFIKEGAQILKASSIDDVVVRALHFFSESFHSEASCAIKNGIFTGLGMEESDLENAVFIERQPVADYLKTQKDTIYITAGLSSDKYNIMNVFIVYEPGASACFILFNISESTAPDNEMSALVTHIVSLAMDNAIYHERETSLRIEEAEMSQTVSVLNRFVEQEIGLSNEDFTAYSVNHPAKSTGGDSAIIRKTSNDKTFICLADVCGKGYSAATLTVMLSTAVDMYGEYSVGLNALAKRINDYMLSKKLDSLFITAFMCLYNPADNTMLYTNCGHEPAFLIKNNETLELGTRNLPLGITEEAYNVGSVTVEKGDVLFVYTDGVIEYINHGDLEAKLRNMRKNTPQYIINTLYADLVKDPSNQQDDFTCAAIKFK